MTTVDPTCWDW